MINEIYRAPVLRRINGVGCSVAGRFIERTISPAYFTLYMFFVFWIPVLPLMVYVVTYEDGRYRFYGKLSLGDFYRKYGGRATASLFGSALAESALFFVVAIVMIGSLSWLFGRWR